MLEGRTINSWDVFFCFFDSNFCPLRMGSYVGQYSLILLDTCVLLIIESANALAAGMLVASDALCARK
jgi:hypothetical protein